MEAEQETINEGKFANEAMNNGISSFMPDMIFEKMVSDFKTAKNIFGEIILKQATGFSSEYLDRNIKI